MNGRKAAALNAPKNSDGYGIRGPGMQFGQSALYLSLMLSARQILRFAR